MSFLSKLGSLLNPKPKVEVVSEVTETPKPLAKRTKKLVEKEEVVNVGVTYLILKFQDGRELLRKVYGSYSVVTDVGQDQGAPSYDQSTQTINMNFLREPSITVEVLLTSLERAEEFLKRVSKTEQTYVDDPRKPTKSEVGKVVTATIIKTEQCLDKVTKYSVEDI